MIKKITSSFFPDDKEMIDFIEKENISKEDIISINDCFNPSCGNYVVLYFYTLKPELLTKTK